MGKKDEEKLEERGNAGDGISRGGVTDYIPREIPCIPPLFGFGKGGFVNEQTMNVNFMRFGYAKA
jgi:hypothetical protein